MTRSEDRAPKSPDLHLAFDHVTTAILIVDRDSRILFANRAATEWLVAHAGAAAEEISGQAWCEIPGAPALPSGVEAEGESAAWRRVFGTREIALTVRSEPGGERRVLEWRDVTDEAARERELERLHSALDGSRTRLMVADMTGTIVYANPAVLAMFRRRKDEIRKVWPDFDADRLLGRNYDDFHRDPSHQRALLHDPERLPAEGSVSLAGLHFKAHATAVFDPAGQQIGNAVEWHDVTEEVQAQRDVEALLERASAGELDARLDAERFTGFMHELALGVNRLLDTTVTPIREVSRVLGHLAEKDLGDRVQGDFKGEFGELARKVNASLDNLAVVVAAIGRSAGDLNQGAARMAQGNEDLSRRAEQQAAALEQTAASMEQITGTVQQNAENAKIASQHGQEVLGEAEGGGEVVTEAIEAMAQINDCSRRISDIIGVIDEIAFQTSLLALNASVEAARAGEQGRGFAVVAQEVRNLAQRSSGAAREIKDLISETAERVESGTRLVDRSGESLRGIVTSVKQVTELIGEIAMASREQATGIEQINKAVAQMDQTTQANQAVAEQAALTGRQLDDLSADLAQLVASFSHLEAETPA